MTYSKIIRAAEIHRGLANDVPAMFCLFIKLRCIQEYLHWMHCKVMSY